MNEERYEDDEEEKPRGDWKGPSGKGFSYYEVEGLYESGPVRIVEWRLDGTPAIYSGGDAHFIARSAEDRERVQLLPTCRLNDLDLTKEAALDRARRTVMQGLESANKMVKIANNRVAAATRLVDRFIEMASRERESWNPEDAEPSTEPSATAQEQGETS